MEGDRSLFLRYDEVEYAWRIVDAVLKAWSVERDFIHTYPAGSWGPDGEPAPVRGGDRRMAEQQQGGER
jgi:glucose-6-phosphate 1-dehydrogenase